MTDPKSTLKQDQGRRGYMTRKRRQPAAYVMDYEQTIIPGHTYQFWLQNTSDIVSRRGRKRKVCNQYLIYYTVEPDI